MGHACAICGGGTLSWACSGRLTFIPGGGVTDLPRDCPRAVSNAGLGLGVGASNSGLMGRLDTKTGGALFARGLFRFSGAGSFDTIETGGGMSS